MSEWICAINNKPVIIKSRMNERLMSDWCQVKTESGAIYDSYFHIWQGWMVKGQPDGLFKYGYVQLKEIVTHFTVTNILKNEKKR